MVAETLDEIVERVVDHLDDLRANGVYPCLTAKGASGACIQPKACICRAQLAWDLRHGLTALARTHALVPREASEEMVRAAFGWREKDSREGLTGEVDMFERALSCAISASDLLASLREGG